MPVPKGKAIVDFKKTSVVVTLPFDKQANPARRIAIFVALIIAVRDKLAPERSIEISN